MGCRLKILPLNDKDKSKGDEMNKKLAIMVGHNSVQRGAVRGEGLTEFEYNLDVQGIMLAKAHEYGIEAKGFWRKQTQNEIPDAYDKVRKWNPDAALELHFNAFSDPRVRGCEALWAIDPFAKDLAVCVLAALCHTFPIRSRGTRYRTVGERGYENVSQLYAPTVLVEPFFVTNSEDWELFVEDPQGVVELARAYLKGIGAYFKEKQKIDDKMMGRSEEGGIKMYWSER
jgi:N-acetylmuramoyl-L-alanine amidase